MELMWNKLEELKDSNMYPFHMPGHKRNESLDMETTKLFAEDITEIDGFDNLHDPRDLIKDSQKRASDFYMAETYFLVNGSTCGVLAAISALADEKDTIIAIRGSHKSLYHAVYIRKLNLEYARGIVNYKYDIQAAIDVEYLKKLIDKCIREKRYPKAIFITSPTYEGTYMNVREISELAHRYRIPLVVDEAHGAHSVLFKSRDVKKQKDAISLGADIVIHSVHKTLPSLTQTALLHVQGNLVNRGKLRRFLRIYQSSSPSYLLMASIDACIDYMYRHGDEWKENVINFHNKILKQTSQCKLIKVAPLDAVDDMCKILISVKNSALTGHELYDIFIDRYKLQPEMATSSIVLMIITGCDSINGIERLIAAIIEIDKKLQESITKENKDLKLKNEIEQDKKVQESISEENKDLISKNDIEKDAKEQLIKENNDIFPEKRYELWKAFDMESKLQKLDDSENFVSADFVNLYPPGIPLLVPGEVISKDMIEDIKKYIEMGLNVQGISNNQILVCVEKNCLSPSYLGSSPTYEK